MNIWKSGSKNSKKAWGDKWLPYLVFIFVGYSAADLLIVAYRDKMLPTKAPPARPPAPMQGPSFGNSYQDIVSRNIFSSEGIIPDPLQLKNDPNKDKEKEAPILSTLPLNLIGTLVHSIPEKSIAAIELKGKNQILSYTPKRDIDNMATVERIERGKVFIRNSNTGRLEYLELKTNNKVAFGAAPPKMTEAPKGDVKQVGSNQFAVSRKTLKKYTDDLSSILMQARALPAKRVGTNEIYGFRLLEIQPGSVFTELGLRPMDVICGVNGSPVTSPQQAMELYSALRTSNNIELCIERDGKNNNFKYSISE